MPTARAAALLRRPATAWCPAAHAGGEIELREAGPGFAPEFVRRPELVDRLAGSPHGLALIVAPPGYGKSSLLAEWAERDERAFVWLGSFSPAASDQAAAEADGDSLVEVVRSRDEGRGCVVVLDDADLVAPAAIRGIVEAVLTGLPPGSMLAIASRTEPRLPIGRLRAHKQLVEIRINDLAMSCSEADALLTEAGFEFEPEAIQALAGRTAGWPVALYLAALSLREHRDAPAGVAQFRGNDHLLTEYLHDEVLSALRPDLLTFLIRTSILDRLSGPVCDTVLGQTGSAQTLADLARASQLLEPLDPAHDSYRWHPLFRDSLYGELRRVEPELEPDLQLRASVWYADDGDADRAIEHACAARDAQRAGDLLWDRIVWYLTHGRSGAVRHWLSFFSHDRIAEIPSLALCAAHGCLAIGDVDGAHQWALTAAAACERDGTPPRNESMVVGGLVIEAAAARAGAAAMSEAAKLAVQRVADDSPWRPVCFALNAVARHLCGDRETAARLLSEAIDLGGDTVPGVTAVCLAQHAMLALEQRDWELAAELADRATDMIVDYELGAAPTAVLVFAAAAASRAHQGRVDEAKRDLRSAMNLLTELGDLVPWYGAEARILLAHASLWLADVVGARTLLAQASRLSRKTPDAAMFQHWFDDAWSYMDTLAETSLAGPSALTIAELRILRFLPSHRSFREIAAQLGVSANTVKTQAHAVYRKLGAASRSEAVTRAQDAGLLGQ